MRVGQRRGAFYGLLIYRQGDRAGRFFSYDFDGNEMMLLPEAQQPALRDIHEPQVHVVIDVEVLHLADVVVAGVEDALLAEFVVRGTRVLVVRQRVRFMGFSFPLGGEKKRNPSPRYYSAVRSHQTVRTAGLPLTQERRAGPIAHAPIVSNDLKQLKEPDTHPTS